MEVCQEVDKRRRVTVVKGGKTEVSGRKLAGGGRRKTSRSHVWEASAISVFRPSDIVYCMQNAICKYVL